MTGAVAGTYKCSATAQQADMMPARASGSATECRSITVPSAAPATMQATEADRRAQPGPLPPASLDSEARPVRVRVSTVVVRSGTASFRTVALRMPMATPVRTITKVSVGPEIEDPLWKARRADTSSRAASAPNAILVQ